MPVQIRSQGALDHAVATATGEDLPTIRRRGFSLVDPHDAHFDDEPDLLPPQYVDWDELELSRNASAACRPLCTPRRVA